ncbi:MAG: hypothetical protein Q9219_005385 [cf. Caloplaca sp. 3 TL-2023]
MHATNLLLLALSALPSTFSLPTTNTTTSSLEKRYNGPSMGSFLSTDCSGQPLTGKMKHPSWSCFKFNPMSDNIGINWGDDRALGARFFTDDKCSQDKYATKTLWAPLLEEGKDNGKGKTNKCISYKANGGNWKSVYFVNDNPWTRAERGKDNHGH